ncbi:uncharacterized protein DUF1203 [Ilumatobacter fluminis]|uniref:Uncharacterized protein DUF1203 n=1 Tax=Ilumatobacter fluminis TaxID=467091 RepID=A0A4R7I1D5_9ACTN|nr:DUF1203 domain-containing protein [Ilumatobacter fluminis]TDT16990.1 uncharacterized protein DUF1203 [Ilumatobacter fluminis]
MVTTIRALPLDRTTADRLRRSGGVVVEADVSPGFPCRQCLRDADVGDALVLVSYDPFPDDADSPYRGRGPIYLHRDDCSAKVDSDAFPRQLTTRRLSLRGFDAGSMMRWSTVVDGADLAEALGAGFRADGVDRIHIHNAGPGCFAAVSLRPAAR